MARNTVSRSLHDVGLAAWFGGTLANAVALNAAAAEAGSDKKTGKVMTDSGSYITVYKKQDDGSWKAVEDFAAADPDTVKAVPPEKPAKRAQMTSSGF